MRAGGAGLTAVAVLLTGLPTPAAAQRVTRPCTDGSGARCGSLRIRWRTRDTHSVASLRGLLGGRRVELLTPAP